MKLVVIDRDGVVNRQPDGYVTSADEWIPIAGSLEAIARLNRGGWRVVVATKQDGLGREALDVERLNAIHDRMQRAIGQAGGHVEAIFFCPCAATDDCACLGPRPTMLMDISARLRVSLADLPIVGASLDILRAAAEVGARPIRVRSGRVFRDRGDRTGSLPRSIETYDDFAGAVRVLLG